MQSNAVTLWSQACGHLKERLSKDVYDRWIAVIEPQKLEDGELVLSVANDFYQTWLEENYLSLIREAVCACTGQNLLIRFAVDHSMVRTAAVEKTDRKAKKPSARAAASSHVEFTLNPQYSFDSFVVGPSNNFAHAATLAVAQSPARAYNPLFIYGGAGLGKTHLMQAIGNHVRSRDAATSVCFISSEAFVNDYIDALQRKGLVQFRKKYRGVDLLLIDDIQFLAGKERMQEEFFHTFNALFDGHKQIVLTCDRPASEIPGLEQRLVSRFEWGLVVELETPDLETRIAILRKKRERMKVDIPDPVIAFIAENIRSNIRRLEGALIRVASYASLTGAELSQDKLENLLRDTLDQSQPNQVTFEHIQRAVAEYYDIRLADMTSRKRPQDIALPRQVAMFLCRSLTNHSLPAIGNAFGRNHATVLHACRLVEKKSEEEADFRHAVQTISQKLTRA